MTDSDDINEPPTLADLDVSTGVSSETIDVTSDYSIPEVVMLTVRTNDGHLEDVEYRRSREGVITIPSNIAGVLVRAAICASKASHYTGRERTEFEEAGKRLYQMLEEQK